MFVAMIRPKFVVALFSRLLNFLVDHFFLFSRVTSVSRSSLFMAFQLFWSNRMTDPDNRKKSFITFVHVIKKEIVLMPAPNYFYSIIWELILNMIPVILHDIFRSLDRRKFTNLLSYLPDSKFFYHTVSNELSVYSCH